ncbi:hypothetical protein HERIO_354 [Hepatospora eriocheir]|uniref:Uncharacterized protein n=1 Tax=Hepatospora eriocheir TaxID=1081669 RepID=A0A1X0QDB0_9MICR|nr:hypothetical protein HERIO_354 [Hepatospora eriocheir]
MRKEYIRLEGMTREKKVGVLAELEEQEKISRRRRNQKKDYYKPSRGYNNQKGNIYNDKRNEGMKMIKEVNHIPSKIILNGKIKNQDIDILIDIGEINSFIKDSKEIKGTEFEVSKPF